MSKRHPVLYANADSPVGLVKVFKCPHCRDGEGTSLLERRVETLEKALRWYANGDKKSEFTIVDDKGQYISDVYSFGDVARKALLEF